jgi:hypothetical protein
MHWFICSRHDLAVSSQPTRYLLDTVPRALASSGSSSHALGLLFRVHDRSKPGCHLAMTATFPGGFSPLRDISSANLPPDKRPTVCLPFRPQCFSHSRRFTLRSALWAYFIPLPRPGFPFQGLSRAPSRLAFRRLVPSWHWRPLPPAKLPQLSSASLLLFRVLLRVPVRPVKQGV